MSIFSDTALLLKQKGYEVSEFDTKEEAVKYLQDSVHGMSVGFGGSITLEEMGLYEVLSDKNKVYWHWRCKDGETPFEVIEKANAADIYFTSANAVTSDGTVVNVDGNCNRISAMVYGHEKVYFVVGKNKLTSSLDDAVDRTRNVAAPLNAKRLGKKTPCVQGGKCFDCQSPDRICKGLSVLWQRPSAQPTEIILINEELGY